MSGHPWRIQNPPSLLVPGCICFCALEAGYKESSHFREKDKESVQHLQHYSAVLISTCGPVLAGFPQTKIPSFLPVAPSTPSDAEGPAKCVSLLSESPSPEKGAGRADAALSLPKTVG